MGSQIFGVERMAQIKITKNIVVGFIVLIMLLAVIIIVLKAKLYTITTNQPDLYQIKLVNTADDNYAKQIKVSPGKYSVLVKGPLFIQPETVDIGIFGKQIIDVASYESERGVDQVIQEKLKDYDIFYAVVSDCQEIESYTFICQYYRASSIKAVQAKYENYKWVLETDESKLTSETAKQRFQEIVKRNIQR